MKKQLREYDWPMADTLGASTRKRDVSPDLPQMSRYIRTSWMLSSEVELLLSDGNKIRFMSGEETQELYEQIRKQNVTARMLQENNFYLKRVTKLADKTVIEVSLPGTPNDIYDKAESTADLIERIALLSTTLALRKNEFHRKLGINERSKEEINFVIGTEFRYLRSITKPEPQVRCITINDRFCRRFERCGFPELYSFCLSSSDLVARLITSINWLFESRIDVQLSASVVKTAIALESLLIFSESESLARSLSERVAFTLTSSPEDRERLSTIIKRFYNFRSGVVHGSKKKMRGLTSEFVEGVDRLVLLLYLVIASNSNLWVSAEVLQQWCEKQRWGTPTTEIHIPFPRSYLTQAMRLTETG